MLKVQENLRSWRARMRFKKAIIATGDRLHTLSTHTHMIHLHTYAHTHTCVCICKVCCFGTVRERWISLQACSWSTLNLNMLQNLNPQLLFCCFPCSCSPFLCPCLLFSSPPSLPSPPSSHCGSGYHAPPCNHAPSRCSPRRQAER